MRIFIGMPTYQNNIHTEVHQNVVSLALEIAQKGDELIMSHPSSPFISLNRNLIMEAGLSSDWILMWDSDIQVPTPKFLYRMIETAYKQDAVIVGLLCKIKTEGRDEFACGMKAKGGYKRLLKPPRNIQEVDVMGAGVTLLKTSWIKENLDQPYYEFIDGKGDNGPTILPEDWRFCEKGQRERREDSSRSYN